MGLEEPEEENKQDDGYAMDVDPVNDNDNGNDEITSRSL